MEKVAMEIARPQGDETLAATLHWGWSWSGGLPERVKKGCSLGARSETGPSLARRATERRLRKQFQGKIPLARLPRVQPPAAGRMGSSRRAKLHYTHAGEWLLRA